MANYRNKTLPIYRGRKIKRISRNDEHPAVVSIPEVVGVAIVAVQPPLVVVAIDTEHPWVAVRIGDRIHGDSEPLTVGLVWIPQAQGGTNFRWAELQAELDGSVVDLLSDGAFLKAQLGDGHHDQVELGFCLADLHLVEDLVGVVADVAAVGLQGIAVFAGRCVSAENDRLPDSEGLLHHLDDELSRQEALHAFHTAELVGDCFDLTKVQFSVLHGFLLSGYLPESFPLPEVIGTDARGPSQ